MYPEMTAWSAVAKYAAREGEMINKKVGRRRSWGLRALAATAMTAGLMITMPFAASADSEAAQDQRGYRLKVTKQGSDKAVFDKNVGKFDVCDKEKDGHGVYVYFSSNPDKYYYDNTSGCTRYKQPEHWYNLGVMYVCEDVWGWDWCSDGVVLKTQ
jgi:hypothetical protein